MFNIYDNGERITDSTKFSVTINIYKRQNPGEIEFSNNKFPGDTLKNTGYDYSYFRSGSLLSARTAEIIIAKSDDTMKIIIDNPKASAWTSIGIDKIEFQDGIFKITENEWPDIKRQKPGKKKSLYFLDENFDWEKIKQ
jgi:hypothetical protein